MSPGGSFVVVWASDNQDGSGWGIFGQQYNSQGVAGWRRVPGQHLHQQRPELSRRRDGYQRRLRRHLGEQRPGRQRLGRLCPAIQRFGCRGRRRVPRQHHHGRRPDLPERGDGCQRRLRDRLAEPGQDGSGWGVYGQRYNSSGVPVGGEFRVNTTTNGDQTRPQRGDECLGELRGRLGEQQSGRQRPGCRRPAV